MNRAERLAIRRDRKSMAPADFLAKYTPEKLREYLASELAASKRRTAGINGKLKIQAAKIKARAAEIKARAAEIKALDAENKALKRQTTCGDK